MTDEDRETLRLIKLRHFNAMPHGVTEALCWKAAILIEKLAGEPGKEAFR